MRRSAACCQLLDQLIDRVIGQGAKLVVGSILDRMRHVDHGRLKAERRRLNPHRVAKLC